MKKLLFALMVFLCGTAGAQPTKALIAKDTINLSNRINAKQNFLTSGSNIKTVNGISLLGSGNLTISGGGGAQIFFDIRDYGAVGDSSTMNTTYIQNAINAAHIAGGTVHVPGGRFLINGTLTTYPNVTIMGDGPGSIIYATTSAPMLQSLNVSFGFPNAVRYGSVSRLQLNGRNVSKVLVNVQNVARMLFDDMQLYNFDTAFKIKGGILIQIHHCDITGGNLGSYVDAGPGNIPSNIVIYDGGTVMSTISKHAIVFTQGAQPVVQNCDVENIGIAGDSTTGAYKVMYPYGQSNEGLGITVEHTWHEQTFGITFDLQEGANPTVHTIADNNFIQTVPGLVHTLKVYRVIGGAEVNVYLARNYFNNADSATIMASGPDIHLYYYEKIPDAITRKIISPATFDFPTGGTAAIATQMLTDAATISFDASLGYSAWVTLGGDRAITFANFNNGTFLTLLVIQDATGGRHLTPPVSNFKTIDGGNGGISLSATPGAKDIICFWKINNIIYCNNGKNYN